MVLVAAVLGLAIADSCGGNCPSGKCPSCACGTTKRLENIDAWCGKDSAWSQACCKCIVSHESGGNANALNYNTNNSLDVGLWQINTVNWGQCSGGNPPCDPNVNLGCAKKVWGWGGNTWKLWSTAAGCGCSGRP